MILTSTKEVGSKLVNFTIHVSQIFMLLTLNSYRAVYQVYLNKTEGKLAKEKYEKASKKSVCDDMIESWICKVC